MTNMEKLMKKYHIIIVNGNEQSCLLPEEELNNTLGVLKQWKNDGRLKQTDKVIIKTIIEYEEEIII